MAATERDGYTPKAREIDLKTMEGSLKALTLEQGDLLIFRLHDPEHDDVRQACDILDKALQHLNLKNVVTAVVMDGKHDVERIPYDLCKKLLNELIAKHEDKAERERLAMLERHGVETDES